MWMSVVGSVCFAAKDAAQDYARLSKLSSDSLLRLGREYYNQDKPNQAFTCLSIISERYYVGISPHEAELCLRAINNIGCIYRYFFYDYAQSYEWFSKGLAICDEVHNENMQLILQGNLSELLDEYAERYSSKQLGEQAKTLMDQCIMNAYKAKNWNVLVTAFFNMTNLKYDADVKKYDFIISKDIPDDTENLKYVRLQYRALEALQQKRYDDAQEYFEQQLTAIDVDEQPERNEIPALLNIAKIYELKRQLTQAINFVDKAMDVARRDSVIDYELVCLNLLSDYHKRQGNTELAQKCYVEYLEKKEQMQSSHLVSIGEMNYIQQLKREEAKANQMAIRQRVQFTLLIFGGILLLIMAVSAVLLYRKNRQLLFSNQTLFEKNQEVMRAEEAEQQLRKQYEQKLQHYHDEQETIRQLSAEQIEQAQEQVDHADSAPEPASSTPQPPSSPNGPSSKYSRSNLSDEYKEMLIYRIQDVLNTPDVICNTDFSLAKLAKLVGSNTAYVSQVINEKTGQTFNIVVGKYRIKEACRRLNDAQNYGHVTIEAISEGVGFKSRSTFVTAFKRQIGLTPSEYIKMAANR